MRKTGLIMLLVIALAPATAVRAQKYPNKPIKLIVLIVPGGATDRVARVVGGKLRLLGVGSEKRNPFMPDSPALAEVMPGFVSTTWAGMVAPPKTPSAIANQLSVAINEALKQPDVAKWLYELSVEVIGGTPAEMSQFMKLEKERWGNVVRATGAQAD